ncbi:hypothetical protein RZE82_01600 [Mollicutes bacterium LVI A0039]|nr:hypothetical protein RZE82_01600 [Mollicutes bacterium LVI A0039]
MLTSLIQFTVNSIIMLLIILGFSIIGQIANHKFFDQRFKYNVPIGFAWFMVTFQVISFPFILLQTAFSTFLIFFMFFQVAWLIYIVLNRQYFTFNVFNGKWTLQAIVVVLVFLVMLAKSIVYSDSWLYSAMITSTIQNNLIYSHNGTLADVQLSIMHHRFESYYLWQAVVSMLLSGKYLLALISEYKLFDAFLLVLTFMELGHQFKMSKAKSAIFALCMFLMLTAQGNFLNLSPFQTSEPPVQLFQLSTGTALYHYYLIPFAIIYLRIFKDLTVKQKNIYLVGMLIAFSSLSTTFYYTLPLYYLTILIAEHLIYKQKDSSVVLAFMTCWLIIISCFIGVMTMNLSYVIVFGCCWGLITKATLSLYQRVSINFLGISTKILMLGYAIGAILLFNPMVFINHDFTTDKQALRLYNIVMDFNNGDYQKIILPVVCLVFIVVILFKIFTSEQFKIYAEYIIIYSVMFLNPFAISMYKLIGIQPVISRIFAFTFIGYLIVIYVFKTPLISLYKVVLIIWVVIAIPEHISKLDSSISSKSKQVTSINSNFDELATYNFMPNSFIVFDNLDATVGSEVYYTGINKLVVLNPALSWSPSINSCSALQADSELSSKYEHCYTIYEKENAIGEEFVFETDKYVIYNQY